MKKRLLASITLLFCIILIICLSSCSKVVFNINFIVDEEIYSSIGTSGGEIITIPDNPTKEGSTFDGWYWDKDEWNKPFTANSLLNAPLSSDMNVYAKWNIEHTHTPVIDPAVEATDVDDGLTEGSHCSDCGETIVAQTVIPAKLQGTNIKSNALTLNGNALTHSVPNSTIEFSFYDDITVAKNASYILSRDSYGEQIIHGKKAPLVPGNNTFYIIVTNGNEMISYTVNIRRAPMYTVHFDTKGGSPVDDIQVIEGGIVTPPESTKVGYTFNSWSYDFSMPIMSDIYVTANWDAKGYKLFFDANGGQVDKPEFDILYGSQFTLPIPTHETGYFLGWYNGDVPFESGTWLFTDNIHLTAKWRHTHTWSEYIAAEVGDEVAVQGIISAIVNTTSNKEIYLQDNDGGYYVYGVDADVIADLQIGQEVRVRGEKKTFNGNAEVVKPTIEVLNATPVTVNPVDITDAIANISDLSSDAVLKYQGMYVKINGAFILGQVSSNSTYYDVLVNGKNGKLLQTYLRISGSANPLNGTDTQAFKNTFNDNVGKDAGISGVVSIYGGKIFLIPCRANALENFQTVDRNDADKLAIEQIIMDKVYDITEVGKVTLQSAGKTYFDVTFTWSLSANDYVTLNGNVLNTPVLPDEVTTITLALTIKAGEAIVVKTYTVRVNAAPTVVADTDIDVVPGTVYVFFVNQKNIPQKLYWDGSLKPNTSFLQTTTNPDKAAKVVAVLVEGTTDKYILYRDINGAKQYINVLDNEKGTSPSVILDRYETNVKNYFSYNAELGIFTVDAIVKASSNSTETKVDTFYFGCYGTHDTISLSSTHYITGNNAAKLDVTQHPARFATLVDTEKLTDAEMVNREKTDLDIKVDFATAGTINLPVNGGLFGKVVITWAAATNNGAVVIENGVLTATPQVTETTVVVTATIKLGYVTETKTFNVVVAASTS